MPSRSIGAKFASQVTQRSAHHALEYDVQGSFAHSIQLVLIMELMDGGQLFHRIRQKRKFTEVDARWEVTILTV